MTQFNNRIEKLSPEKRRLLERLALKQSSLSERQASDRLVGRRRGPDPLPLSFAQQRIWLLQQMEPQSAAYNLPGAIRLHGRLDANALESALNDIISRHEVLRTGFPTFEGQPVQKIHAARPLSLPLLDLSQLDPTGSEAEAQRLAREQARQPFDLASDHLIRAQLVRRGQRDHLLLITLHHIVADDWSIGLLFKELATVYHAFSRSEASPLSQPPCQYADYASWQREWVEGASVEKHLDYWRGQLSRELPVLNLHFGDHHGSARPDAGARIETEVSSAVTDLLRLLSQREGATLFMTLFAAFATLLHRWTGEEDIIISVPVAGRNISETEGLIGIFLNTLALRTEISCNPTFTQLLRRIKVTAAGAYANQDLPFEKLIEKMGLIREAADGAIFRVMFNFISTPGQEIVLPDLTLSLQRTENQTSKLDLTVGAMERAKGLKTWFEYRGEVFEPSAAQRLIGQWQTLLESIARRPEARISDLKLFPESEFTRVESFPVTTETRSVVELFEMQAERAPDLVAVTDAGEALTCRMLARRAKGLAQRLRRAGIGAEIPVAVFLERSAAVNMAALAIFTAGGVYLPIEIRYSTERVRSIIDDAQPGAVLTHRSLADALPNIAAQVIFVDDECDDDGAGAPFASLHPDQLACILYTSGSTGPPKGTLLTHRMLSNRFSWELAPFQLGEICCQKTALSFIDSLWEMFAPILRGTPTVVLSDEDTSDPGRMVETLARCGVTRIVLVPSLLSVILDEVPDLSARAPRLRLWISTGETLSWELFDRFSANVPHADLLNLYGTTEIWDASHHCAVKAGETGQVPIGRAAPNVQAAVFDRYLNLLPADMRGELYVGGAGISRGYLKHPSLTAERFVPDPTSMAPGARLYRTGDLAGRRHDGTIKLFGRADHQVKVRGHRVDLAEVESRLIRHPDVKESAVTQREHALVAFIVAREGQSLEECQLREFLRHSLPEAMVPSIFAVLDRLPHTPSGKIDRRKLASIPVGQKTRQFTPPRTPTEHEIAEIWRELFGTDSIGIFDDFFDLGGHSLLAARLLSRLRVRFFADLTLKDVLSLSTIEGLAAHLDDALLERATEDEIAAALDRLADKTDEQIREMLRTGGEFNDVEDQ